MNKGTVKFFNDSKGFGFIKNIANNEEIFVHISGLIDQIKENDSVTFDTQQGQKGLNAINVRIAK
jgi:CspA family cold shock protein